MRPRRVLDAEVPAQRLVHVLGVDDGAVAVVATERARVDALSEVQPVLDVIRCNLLSSRKVRRGDAVVFARVSRMLAACLRGLVSSRVRSRRPPRREYAPRSTTHLP